MHRDEHVNGSRLWTYPDDDGDRVGWALDLERLLEFTVLAIPSCIGISLIVGARPPALSMSALRAGWRSGPVLSSWAVRLPRPLSAPVTEQPAELVLYAEAPGAFAAATPSLLALLDVTARDASVDLHLQAPDLAEEQAARVVLLQAHSAIDRAVGVLLDRGTLPEQGRATLVRLAAVGGTSVLDAADVVIESATPAPDPV